MNLVCVRCSQSFHAGMLRGYCPACVKHFREQRKAIAEKQHPSPNVLLDGKFADAKECPKSVSVPEKKREVCGLCGSDSIDPGYGVTGYGFGSYDYCLGCETFLNFHEDKGD